MITFTQAIEGHQLYTDSRQLSPHTLADYHNTYRKFLAFLGHDPILDKITSQQIEAFLAAQQVSKKTILNYHTGLSALWTWAYKNGYCTSHILHQVDRPKPQDRAIIPFSEKDLQALLAALTTSKFYRNHGTLSRHQLPNEERNRAIILLLLDTGLRADELCCLKIQDLDLKNNRLHIRYGKGGKERYVPICTKTGAAIWKTLTPTSRAGADPTDPLFITAENAPLDRQRLRQQLRAIGKRACVPRVNPHRFRHTFAIMFLRNGGDIYSLQSILGHSTLDMCKRYLHLASTDLASSHRRASPVANMRL